ncbi:3-hydroxypropanoate dehydrogenase [Herbihabitans rhizosphaerae]|uniref:3-hydroxypropanoate dehydrogenase n=1 Tax=Herbihabitans rhizosphaerae TaxID=1872711 RepID=A0A4Q7KHL6_9PSEU|nr:malonic semialdehyde reductase [Herbihabitans rhizosphaerae]RZS34388.1 3-hydroxypropanoate dehydrogenase [Herbihabitans rhizosphaerae]
MTVTQEQVLALAEDSQDLLFREARTANTFSAEPVTDEQIKAIYDLVKWAPTSLNMQPLRAVLVRSPEARERLVQHLGEGNQAKTSTAPLTAILAADTGFNEHLPEVFPHAPDANTWLPPDSHEHHAKLNASLQVAYFILGVRAAGLAAGPMTGFDAEGIDKEFFGDDRHRTLVVVNIGKPGENAWFPRSPRLDFDRVFRTV